MIEVKNVKKRYSSNTLVVNNISFTVKPGTIYGLLGPNGAGKTTMMQMISTLSKPTEGQILVCGMDTCKQPLEIHKKIGYLTTEVKLDPMSTPNDLYDFFAILYDLPKEAVEQKKAEDFARFGIGPFQDKRIAELSTGMKQKVSICISLIHNPPVIIFDEPTNGLDILTSKQVTDYLMDLKKQNRTIILSTHIFSLAEDLCDEIGIQVDGKLVASGSARELCELTGKDRFEDAFFALYVEHHKDN